MKKTPASPLQSYIWSYVCRWLAEGKVIRAETPFVFAAATNATLADVEKALRSVPPPAGCYLFHTTMKKADALSLAYNTPPSGPGFPLEVQERVAKVEVWATSIKRDGKDFVEFRAFDDDGLLIATKRIKGY